MSKKANLAKFMDDYVSPFSGAVADWQSGASKTVEFITRLGPERVISITRDGTYYEVWYWEEDNADGPE